MDKLWSLHIMEHYTAMRINKLLQHATRINLIILPKKLDMLYDSKVLKNVKLTYDIRSQNTSGISEKILRDSVNKEDSCKIQNKKLGYCTTSEFETPVGKVG